MTASYQKNPERDINLVDDVFRKFSQFGDVLYSEQRAIYNNLAQRLNGQNCLEVGCGLGFGANILKNHGVEITATDKDHRHIRFAQAIYPHISFFSMDLKYNYGLLFDNVICIEVIEHIDDVNAVLENLINTAKKKLWVSSPNRNNPNLGQDRPINDYHVKEYTPGEMLEMLSDYDCKIVMRDPLTFYEVARDTEATPLVYEIFKA